MRRADRRVLIIKLGFVGLFAAISAAIWMNQVQVAGPRNACLAHPGAQWLSASRSCQIPPGAACEAAGNWWDPVSKSCARVVHIPDFTGRK